MTLLPIPIPEGYIVKVKKDQKISQGDTIATPQESFKTSDLTIDIVSDLESDHKNSIKLLVKKPGDRVETGDVIAKKGGVFGSREIKSKVSGTVLNFDEESGIMTIRTGDEISSDSKEEAIISPVDGDVSVCDNDKVVLKTDKEAILAVESSGESAFAQTLVLEEEEAMLQDLSDKVLGKIVIGKIIDREVVAKAIGLGAVGIIGEEISESIFENLRSKKIKIPVLKVSEENFKKINKKGEKLMLDSQNLIIFKV